MGFFYLARRIGLLCPSPSPDGQKNKNLRDLRDSVVKNNKSKKQGILKTAARLFAAQGFEATTTSQIARDAGATEPLIYYHFKGKDDLFTRIIDATFSEYFSRIDKLEKNPDSPFGQIQNLIELQYDIAEPYLNKSRGYPISKASRGEAVVAYCEFLATQEMG